ncbi:GL10196 [Drosophila persimilis]|uniref:GDP-L-fucose synthase n=1 Tax=Drosophila persimilis TaxID=7234 RepID=B4H506_DROPE|nr:GL10196 [Drosophila persimilis]
MKKVLVTGGTGLVGKALEAIIKKQGPTEEEWFFAGSKDADLTNLAATQALFTKEKPTHVIHLAAMVGGLFHNMNNNLDFLRNNLLINDNVLQTAHEQGCIKSSHAYETMVHNGPPHPSNYGYSYAKRLIDIQNHAYNDKYGHLYTSVIPCNIFGPHDNYKPEVSHVIPGMINRMHKLITEQPDTPEREKVFTVFGSGKPLRQFIYSLDLAELMIWVLRNYDSVEPIVLSVDEIQEVTIFEVAQAIATAFEFKGKLVCDTSKADGQFKKTASNAKLRSLLPEYTFTDFESAIKTSVEWYRTHYEQARK